MQDAKPYTGRQEVSAKDQPGVPQVSSFTVETNSHQKPKLEAIDTRRTAPKLQGQSQTMSGFSFSKAGGVQHQKDREGALPFKSKATPDTGSNGMNSKPTADRKSDASREESAFWKEKGNLAFKAKKWEVAAEAYSRSARSTRSMPLRNITSQPLCSCLCCKRSYKLLWGLVRGQGWSCCVCSSVMCLGHALPC